LALLHKLETAPRAGRTRDGGVGVIWNDDIIGLVEPVNGGEGVYDRGWIKGVRGGAFHDGRGRLEGRKSFGINTTDSQLFKPTPTPNFKASYSNPFPIQDAFDNKEHLPWICCHHYRSIGHQAE
jgi:hypothetical protein